MATAIPSSWRPRPVDAAPLTDAERAISPDADIYALIAAIVAQAVADLDAGYTGRPGSGSANEQYWRAQARRRGRATSNAYFIHELRDRAILLMLLDTGIRAGELVALTVGDAHLPSGRIEILDGKGGKSRVVWLGDHSRPALWRYLQERPNVDPGAPLFLSGDGPMTRSWLRKRLVILGERAGVAGVYPHRFRHTFAVQYLRNGGDVFTLQALLGHSSLAMVQHYLRLAQADVEHAHRRASPVDNWLK